MDDNDAVGSVGGTGLGGGVLAFAPLTIATSSVSNNTASASANEVTGLGGGIFAVSTTTITNSELLGNEAANAIGAGSQTGWGGAIYSGNNGATNIKLSITGSTLSGNEAGTGSALLSLSTSGTNDTAIDKSTITGNNTTNGSGSIVTFHPISIVASTVVDNTASTGSGGAYFFAPATARIAGSIVADNQNGNCVRSGNVAIVDGGHNLSNDTTCGFTVSDVLGDPQLEPLAANGGPTDTRMPGPSSPAINKIPVGYATGTTNPVTGAAITLCAAGSTDQRGVARPQGVANLCDIGAVEADLAAPIITGPASAVYSVGVGGAPQQFLTIQSPTASFEISAGTLPANVTLTDNGDGTATIQGIPAAGTGGFHAITIKATNSEGSDTHAFTLEVLEAPEITGPSAATFQVGMLGTTTPDFVQIAGHPDATYSVVGSLPAGVGLQDDLNGHARITGVPGPGTGNVYPVTIKASNGTAPDDTLPFTLTVNQSPTITPPANATFEVGSPGTTGTFTTTGFPAPTITAVGLPTGLGVTSTGPGTATITGTPGVGQGGVHDVTVTAANGVAPDASTPYTITVNEDPVVEGSASVRFVVGTPNLVTYSTDGFPMPSLEASGDMPDGVTFDDNGDGTGTLSGTAPASELGSHVITITATNAAGSDDLVVTIEVVPPVTITTTTLPNAPFGAEYLATIQSAGGQLPYTYQLVGGSLPAGLTLNIDGTITGTPTGPLTTSNFTVQVTDGDDPAQTDTQALSITVTAGATTLQVNPVILQPTFLGINIGYVVATLRGPNGVGIPGQTIIFWAGPNVVCVGVTAANGTATCGMTLLGTLQTILNFGVFAQFPGTATWLPSSGSAGLI